MHLKCYFTNLITINNDVISQAGENKSQAGKFARPPMLHCMTDSVLNTGKRLELEIRDLDMETGSVTYQLSDIGKVT